MVFLSVVAGWLTHHYTPVGISKNLMPTSTVRLLKTLSVEDFLLLPGYHRQLFIYKKTIAVFTQGKALRGGLYRNWAHTQLHLIRALMPVKPAPKAYTELGSPFLPHQNLKKKTIWKKLGIHTEQKTSLGIINTFVLRFVRVGKFHAGFLGLSCVSTGP